ncbi:hypothetical protein ACFFK7_12360 [Pseudoalteromonas xiamenensis]|uniref:hypothetical protein n=1 Tax=Pseudoalteromonas xiamenensis TaxID=882626 RepID=UPI0035E4B1D6
MANYQQPPKLAERFLRWSLPEELKEPLLGDLAEEFQLLHFSNQACATQWYLKQVLRTSNQYIWQTKKGILMFVLSLFVFSAMSYMALWFSVDGSIGDTFADLPSLILTFPPAILFAIGVTSVKDMKNAFALLYNDELALSSLQMQNAKQFYRVLGNTAVLMSIFTAFIGAVAIAVNIEDVEHEFGPALGVCMLVLMYSFGLKTVCYAAEQKVQYRLNSLNAVT